MSRPSRLAILAGFAAIYVIWGSTYLAIRLAVESIPPFLMAAARFLLAGAAFIGWATYRGAQRPAPWHWVTTGVIGTMMAAGGIGLVSWAIQTVPSGLAALLVSMVPFWIVLIDWLKPGGHRPAARIVLGVVLGFAGVALLVDPADVSGGRQIAVGGAAAILVGSILWAGGSVYSRHAPQPASQALSSGMQMFGGGVVLLTLSVGSSEMTRFEWASISHVALAGWVYFIVMGSVAYGSYLWLMKASTPHKVATYAYVNPVIALFLGYVLADESLSAWTIGCSPSSSWRCSSWCRSRRLWLGGSGCIE